MEIALETRIEVPDGVVFRRLERDAVLLDVEAGRYFGLDEVATRMWTALSELGTVGRALDALEAEYDVARPRLRRDLEELVGDLADRRLLRLAGPAHPGD